MKWICNTHMIGYYLVWLLSALNLWVMHYYFFINDYLGDTLSFSHAINICSVVIDVVLALSISLAITFGRLRISTFITYGLTLIWSFINTFYGRFFFHYLSLSAINQAEGLTDEVVIKSMLSGFQWYDYYYILSLLSFFYLLFHTKFVTIKLSVKRIICIAFFGPLLSLFFSFSLYSLYHIVNSSTRGNVLLYKYRVYGLIINPTDIRNAYPNEAVYHAGVIRSLCSEIKELLIPYKLSNEKRQLIRNEYTRHETRSTNHEQNPQIKNVIFILLESFMSISSDLTINGKIITPFLNSLKHSTNVYYNGNVNSNITIGESGDGQFIYMTGILPLRAKYTVGEVKNNKMPFALPRLLKKHFNIKYTEIVIPSSLNVWQQENMNKVYDLKHCYSRNMVEGNQGEDLTDESVFQLAMKTPKVSKQPFFSMVLSISTHQPYREFIDPNFTLKDSSLPKAYLIYLNACHYADTQIRKYFEYLKKEGIYDNSLIIIASDHHAHLDAMGMDGKISPDLPLYIINGNIDNSKAYSGPCNQLDVYTTILDLLGINCKWLGLGKSILTSKYSNSVDDNIYELSEDIIMSDYFRYNHE